MNDTTKVKWNVLNTMFLCHYAMQPKLYESRVSLSLFSWMLSLDVYFLVCILYEPDRL